jgi:peptidase C25-like protein
MKFLLFVPLFLFLLSVSAQQVILDDNSNSFEIESNSFENISVLVSLNQFDFQKVNVKGKDFFTIKIDGFSKSIEVGQPEFPVITRLIQIPEYADVVVENVVFSEDEIDLLPYTGDLKLKPVQTPVFKSENPNKYPFKHIITMNIIRMN